MKAPAAEHGGRRHLFSQLLVWGQGRQRLRVGNQSNTQVLAGLVRKWAVGVLATCLVFSTASAQVRVVQNSEPRIEFINESVAIPPKIERDQLSAPQVVQAPTTPISTEAKRLRQLEALANASSPNPSLASTDARTPAEAAWLLGLMYLHGVGAGLNPGRAREWFAHAGRLHHPLAPAGLAWCQLDGCGYSPEPETAQPWIAQLRKADTGRALYLEWYRAQLLAPLQVATPSQPEVATRQPSALLLRAVKAGDTYAENELGIFRAEQGQLAEAKRLFSLAARNSPAAQANIGWVNRHQKVKQDALVVKPATSAGGQDTFLRARQFHRGDGVPINYAEALRLYRLAASQGNPFAQKMLALIYTRPTPTGDINVVWMQQLANVDVTKEGGASLLAPPPSPSLIQDSTPLFDYLPVALRKS